MKAKQKSPRAGHLQLAEWLEEKGYNPAQGARAIGVTRQVMHKWLKGVSMRKTSALLIEAKTKIPASSFTTTGSTD